jgi:hypothetical protein
MEPSLTEKRRLGKLPPMYNFVLNPHAETRVSTCPGCEQRMRQRKVPLFIHVDPMNPVVIGYTCRYCPDCDLLVAHQDEIEGLLAGLFAEHDPSLIGNDYLVMGTVERAIWRESMKTPKHPVEILEHTHDFKEVWSLEFRPGGWYSDDQIEAEDREIAAARAAFRVRTGQGPRPEPPPRQRKRRRKKSTGKRKKRRS